MVACSARTGTRATRVAAASDVETNIYLIGDAGAPDLEREPVLEALASDAADATGTAVIVFLGDNIYPKGLPAPDDEGRPEAERRLRMQIDAVLTSGANGIFIPGNHDWDFAGDGRRERLLRAEMFGESIGRGKVEFMPADACPGPQTVDIDQVRLVIVDTQWWLFKEPMEDVPGICASKSKEAMLDSLRTSITSAGDRHVIVAGHHPLDTGGPHGGYFTVGQHLFPLREKYRWGWLPLPVIGSIYPMARRLGITDQDVFHARYQAMRAAFESVFLVDPPLVYASGHEHSQQLLTGIGARYQIVTGTGAWGHLTPVAAKDGTLFAASESGYVRLQVQRDGRVRFGMIFVDERGARREAYSTYLE
jgi:hypothetical protein